MEHSDTSNNPPQPVSGDTVTPLLPVTMPATQGAMQPPQIPTESQDTQSSQGPESSQGPPARDHHGTCAVPGCPSRRQKGSKLPFHRVPTKDNKGRPHPLREMWLKFCGLNIATPMGTRLDICGLHFLPQDYKPDSQRHYPGVFPTQNLPGWKLEGPPVVQFPEEGEVVSIEIDDDDVLADQDTEEDEELVLEIDIQKDEDMNDDVGHIDLASDNERSSEGEEDQESDFELGSEDFLESSDEDVSIDEEVPSDSVDKDLRIAQLTRKLNSVKVRISKR